MQVPRFFRHDVCTGRNAKKKEKKKKKKKLTSYAIASNRGSTPAFLHMEGPHICFGKTLKKKRNYKAPLTHAALLKHHRIFVSYRSPLLLQYTHLHRLATNIAFVTGTLVSLSLQADGADSGDSGELQNFCGR